MTGHTMHNSIDGPSRRLFVATGLVTLLAGCSVTRKPAPRTFDLRAADSFPSGTGGSSSHIVVMSPRALEALNSEKILVRQAGGEISFFPGAQWSGNLTSLVRARLTQSFENTGRVRAVGQQGDGIAADYLIVPEIRDFSYSVEGEKVATVSIFVKIINDRSGRVVASEPFKRQIPVSSDDLDSVVNALAEAFVDLQKGVVKFTLARI